MLRYKRSAKHVGTSESWLANLEYFLFVQERRREARWLKDLQGILGAHASSLKVPVL
jgi:hypothetical protein